MTFHLNILTTTYALHIVCPIPFKPLLPESSCLAKASTRSHFYRLPQIPAILHYARVHQVLVIPRSNAQSFRTPAAREVPPGYLKPRRSRKAGTKWPTSSFWREVISSKHLPCGGSLPIRFVISHSWPPNPVNFSSNHAGVLDSFQRLDPRLSIQLDGRLRRVRCRSYKYGGLDWPLLPEAWLWHV